MTTPGLAFFWVVPLQVSIESAICFCSWHILNLVNVVMVIPTSRVNVYCEYCGVYCDPAAKTCSICGMDQNAQPRAENSHVCIDVSRSSNLRFRTASIDTGPLAVDLCPTLWVRRYLSLQRNHTSYVPVLTSIAPQLHPINGEPSRRCNRISALLRERGFETLLYARDHSVVRPLSLWLLVNRKQGQYCSVHLSARTGRPLSVGFTAITNERKIVSFDNARVMELGHPPNLRTYHFPSRRVGELYEDFRGVLQAAGGKLLTLEACNLLPILRAIRIFTVERGVEKQVLALKQR